MYMARHILNALSSHDRGTLRNGLRCLGGLASHPANATWLRGLGARHIKCQITLLSTLPLPPPLLRHLRAAKLDARAAD